MWVSVEFVPISTEHAGRAYPSTAPYEVTQAKISEFEAALGLSASASTPRQAPPTFGVVVTHEAWNGMFTDPELGVSLDRTIHGDQRFTYVRPLCAGDVVTAVLQIQKIAIRGTSERIGVLVSVHDQKDRLMLTAEATLFHNREAGV